MARKIVHILIHDDLWRLAWVKSGCEILYSNHTIKFTTKKDLVLLLNKVCEDYGDEDPRSDRINKLVSIIEKEEIF